MNGTKDLVTDIDDLPLDEIKDETNPHSVISMSPSVVQQYIRAVPDDVLEMPIEDLEKKANVTERERKLRIAFWMEYERSKRHNSKVMNYSNIYKGIMHYNEFYRKAITNSYKLAYLISPPEDYKIKLEEMLDFALSEERKILAMPIEYTNSFTDKFGNVIENKIIDSKLAAVKHKIRESLQNRLQGMPVHRSMQITEQIHRNGDYGGASIAGGGIDLNNLSNDQLKSYIDTLGGSHDKSANTVDVTPVERDITPSEVGDNG